MNVKATRAKTEVRVRAFLSICKNVVEKNVMGGLAFMVDGSMCCSVGEMGLLVHVKPSDRDTLLANVHVTPMKLGRRTMRGFVRVAPNGYRTDAALASWLERGIAAGKK